VPKKVQDITDKMKKALNELEQGVLFGSNNDILLEACVEYARHCGCSVKLPTQYSHNTNKLDDLVSLFYSEYDRHYPDNITPYNSETRDRKVAKLFVAGRMKADGISREKALEQCAAIIEAVFKHKEKLNFESSPSFSMFGAENMSWLTNKVLDLMAKDTKKFEEAAVKLLVEEQTNILINSGEHFGRWTDEALDEAFNTMKERK
jgi:hypothetical protein